MNFFRHCVLGIVAGLIYCLLSFHVVAATELEKALTEAQDQQLANEVTWLKLLHYKEDRGSESGWVSEVHSENFFLYRGE